MRYADAAECGLPFARYEVEPWDGRRRVDWRKVQLRPPGFDGSTAVGPGIGLEIHAVGSAESEVRGERGTAERGVAAHGGVRAVGIVIGHPDRAGVRPWRHEDNAVGTDSGAARAHRLHV